ncbi:phytoene desaturase family protein [Galactobacter caseinivorans]|uniref:NAD(P)/FAD-dependent oxidoreductase n=1 Tax=Galactobacter caseinivorans TaxID=2676123 RepID=A0A496PI45_9MICC|nr:NAD(P)/FAD-dependent oxidoreductase [Galactobacter caseinivorans]RKW70145.1 NAD(P)/FAD-dependent oxidoreductase [Galactobacter caseinivorans]
MTSAAVIGSGPNGLAAAVVLARAGVDVTVYEGAGTPGGGLRTVPFGPAAASLQGSAGRGTQDRDAQDHGTQNRAVRDVCSASHPMVLPSPFMKALKITQRVDYVSPEISYAHALRPGHAVAAYRDLERTAQALGPDGEAWKRLLGPLAARVDELISVALNPMVRVPPHPILTARFGLRVLEQSTALGALRWKGEEARALLAGVMAHGIVRQPSFAGAAAGLTLAATAHAGGWPIPLGGAQVLATSLLQDIEAHGGSLRLGRWVESLAELDQELILADVSAKGLAALGGDAFPASYRRSLGRVPYGPGVSKLDVLLDGPVPWVDPLLAQAATVHVGGTAREVNRGENHIIRGGFPERPFVLAVQPGVVDPSRAPHGQHVLWAYAHSPHGNDRDQTQTLLGTLEHHAPGLRDRIVHVQHSSAAQEQAENPNYVGGDISSGALSAYRLFARPVLARAPWRTPVKGVYLCSSAAVPGPGVHGMPGFLAARTALADAGIPLPGEFVGL